VTAYRFTPVLTEQSIPAVLRGLGVGVMEACHGRKANPQVGESGASMRPAVSSGVRVPAISAADVAHPYANTGPERAAYRPAVGEMREIRLYTPVARPAVE